MVCDWRAHLRLGSHNREKIFPKANLLKAKVSPLSTDIPEGITNPPVDDLLDQVDSKYRLVLFAAKRARQINAYYAQLGEGLLENVGPLVETGLQEKSLSIALREIQANQLEYREVDPAAEAAARAEAMADPQFNFTDPFGEIDPA